MLKINLKILTLSCAPYANGYVGEAGELNYTLVPVVFNEWSEIFFSPWKIMKAIAVGNSVRANLSWCTKARTTTYCYFLEALADAGFSFV
jgi:hypothetical protein